MSTRITLWHNEDFHLYEEGFDNENVYLEIKTAPFIEQLVVKIPLPVWKEMRKHTIEPCESYLDLSDEELTQEAARSVDEHRAWLDAHRSSPVSGLSGVLLFGPPESSREKMVEKVRQLLPAEASLAVRCSVYHLTRPDDLPQEGVRTGAVILGRRIADGGDVPGPMDR